MTTKSKRKPKSTPRPQSERCHCTTETLRHNIQRADAAETRVRELEQRVARQDGLIPTLKAHSKQMDLNAKAYQAERMAREAAEARVKELEQMRCAACEKDHPCERVRAEKAEAREAKLREAAQEMLDYTSSWSDVRMHTIRNKIRAELAEPAPAKEPHRFEVPTMVCARCGVPPSLHPVLPPAPKPEEPEH